MYGVVFSKIKGFEFCTSIVTQTIENAFTYLQSSLPDGYRGFIVDLKTKKTLFVLTKGIDYEKI